MTTFEQIEQFADFQSASAFSEGDLVDVSYLPHRSPNPYVKTASYRAANFEVWESEKANSMLPPGAAWSGQKIVMPLIDHERDQLGSSVHWLAVPTNQANNLLHAFANQHGNAFSRRALRNVRTLLDAIAEDGDTLNNEAIDSLKQMWAFLSENRDLQIPDFTFTPKKYFRAEWRRDKGELIAIEFRPAGTIVYVIFAPDNLRGIIQRVSGTTSREKIRGIAAAHGVTWWLGEQRR